MSLRGIHIYTIYGLNPSRRIEKTFKSSSSDPAQSNDFLKDILSEILRGETKSLSAAFCDRIFGNQYQHASCTQTLNCSISWNMSDICYIFYGCLVLPFLLMRKLLVAKVGMWIRWKYSTRMMGCISGGCSLWMRIYSRFFIEELRFAKGIHIDRNFIFEWSCISLFLHQP